MSNTEQANSPTADHLQTNDGLDNLIGVLEKISNNLEQLFEKQIHDKIMDPDEAAAYLKISRKRLMELVKQGDIPHITFSRDKDGNACNRNPRFHRDRLDELVRNGGTRSTEGSEKVVQLNPPRRNKSRVRKGK